MHPSNQNCWASALKEVHGETEKGLVTATLGRKSERQHQVSNKPRPSAAVVRAIGVPRAQPRPTESSKRHKVRVVSR